VTVEVSADKYLDVMQILRNAGLPVRELMDLCGVDYSTYAEVGKDGPRFAVVSHLLS
jgi:NADH-quinone oxidoreductase subunit C